MPTPSVTAAAARIRARAGRRRSRRAGGAARRGGPPPDRQVPELLRFGHPVVRDGLRLAGRLEYEVGGQRREGQPGRFRGVVVAVDDGDIPGGTDLVACLVDRRCAGGQGSDERVVSVLVPATARSHHQVGDGEHRDRLQGEASPVSRLPTDHLARDPFRGGHTPIIGEWFGATPSLRPVRHPSFVGGRLLARTSAAVRAGSTSTRARGGSRRASGTS